MQYLFAADMGCRKNTSEDAGQPISWRTEYDTALIVVSVQLTAPYTHTCYLS